jgi:transposase
VDETDSGPRPRVPDSGHYDVASDGGAETWAILASLLMTARLNDIDPLVWLSDVLERIVSGQVKVHELQRLLVWNWKAARAAKIAVAA